jgi:PmbA protein
MMLDTILELLKESEADAYEVTDRVTEGWEFYFIRHQLDQNRIRKTRHTTVRVFRNLKEGQMIGNASDEIPPTASRKEAKELIDSLIKRASYVPNPWYELNPPRQAEGEPESELPDITQIAGDFLDTFSAIPETETEYLNSYEIFANVVTTRFINSRGVDVTGRGARSTIEVVVNAKKESHEIELYRIYDCGKCDREELTRQILETMQTGRDRLRARPMPKLGRSPVVFSTREACELFSFFTNRMSVDYKKKGYTDFETGKPILDGCMEQPITVEVLRELPNSSENKYYDAEGAPIRDTFEIRDGIAEEFLGNRQFSAYLGLESSFIPGNFRISGGSFSEEALREGDFLEAVEFSDFQTDPLSGNIAGEIRLAYWHHGGEVTPVYGGSISGTMLSLAKTMKMSENLRQYDCMEIPAVVRLEDVDITGIEEITEA